MSESAPTLRSSLEISLDIHRVEENLDQIVSLGEQFVSNAPTGTRPCCAWDTGSLSRRSSSKPATPHQIIVLDMGGSHTKVATKNANGEWSLLFDHLNDWFEPRRDSSLPLLQGFFRVLVRELVASLPSLRTSGLPLRVGVIWSNQVKTERFSTGKTTGVTGIVHGFQSGGYRKGEWFLQGLHNGDDIGALLLAEFTNAGITPELMILGNDTLFTLFATPGAHAGVVMSSGGNCTLVGTSKSDKDELFNSELGGMLMLPDSMLSEGDKEFARSRGLSSISLEELSAGNWFPTIVKANILAGSRLPEGKELQPIAAALADGSLAINNRALCDLLTDSAHIFDSFPMASIEALRSLTRSLVKRAATLAGVMTYLSVVTQLRAGENKARISLDSSMARYFPNYFDTMQRCIKRITLPGHEVEIVLVHPVELPNGGDISVPLQGAALLLESTL
ncbi:MAG: hypothetical protein RIS36_88 [Pseudomonadota bacterium]|jgi:hypothetical protein